LSYIVFEIKENDMITIRLTEVLERKFPIVSKEISIKEKDLRIMHQPEKFARAPAPASASKVPRRL